MMSQDNAPHTASAAYAEYASTLELGFTACRIAITADTINGCGAVLFDRLVSAPDSANGFAVVRDALDVIEAFVTANKPVIQ